TLVDNSVAMRDITASIVDLAVRGYLVIEEQQKDHLLGLTHSKEYVFHLKKSQAEWNTLQPHEQALLSGLFSGGNAGDSVSLSELHNRFYTSLPGISVLASSLACFSPGVARPSHAIWAWPHCHSSSPVFSPAPLFAALAGSCPRTRKRALAPLRAFWVLRIS